MKIFVKAFLASFCGLKRLLRLLRLLRTEASFASFAFIFSRKSFAAQNFCKPVFGNGQKFFNS